MVTTSVNVNEKANLIWAIADKLTGPYKPHEYGEVILPLTVIRRFDCILEPTKEAVVQKNKDLNIAVKDPMLRKASGYSFYRGYRKAVRSCRPGRKWPRRKTRCVPAGATSAGRLPP